MSTSETRGQKPEDSSDGKRYTVREQLRFLKDFWVAPDQKKKARWMLVGILALTGLEIGLTAGIGFGFKIALDALVAKDVMTFGLVGGATIAGMATSTIAGNQREFMTNHLGQNWRGWLTNKFNEAWLTGKSYLRLQHDKKYVQNPDQRIAETIGNVTGTTLGLGLGLFRSVVSTVTFAVMLWHIAPIMLGAAVGAAVVCHAAINWAGGPMRGIWRALMDTEAKFRHALGRVRDNAKTIALTGYEPVEKETLKEEFGKLDNKRREFYKANYRTGLVWGLNWQASQIVPIALSVPKFIAGTATLGSLELTRQAYGQFYGAVSWFPQGYSQIASWSANVGQLMDFKRDLEENKQDMTEKKADNDNTPKPVAAQPKAQAPKPPGM
jgi:putative ATP-binding cassette transporter